MRRLAFCLLIALSTLCGQAQEISLDRADALLKAGKWAEARKVYDQLLPSLSGDALAKALNQVGYSYERDHNQLDKAIETHHKAIAVPGASDESKAYAWMRIGYCLKGDRKFDEATKAFAQIDDLPDTPPTLRAESLLYRAWGENSGGKIDDAMKTMRRVIALDGAPGSLVATAWHSLGSINERAKRYPEALDAYEHVIAERSANSIQKSHARSQIAEIKLLMKGDLPFYINPYVTQVTGTGARLSWVSQGHPPVATVTVEGVGEMGMPEQLPLKATECMRQTVELTGLQPGKTYAYTVRCGDAVQTGSFRTSPPPGTPVRFAVLGDTQSEPELHRPVANAIAADHPDVVLHVGDLTDHGATWGRWRAELFEPGSAYFQKAVFAPAVGNHDGGPYYPQLFDALKDYYYSFEYGDVCVLVLDSYWGGQSKTGRPKQLAWAEEVLSQTKAKWKIVSLHVPMVATRQSLKWFGREDFMPLLEKYGVDVVVCGHHPMYRHYLPVGEPGHKPVLNITTGGGGPVGDPVPSPLMIQGAGLCHHSLITIDGNRLELVAKQPDGTVIDRFSLVKTDGKYQDEVMKQAIAPELAWKVRSLYEELLTPNSYDLLVGLDAPPRAGQPCRFVIELDKLARGGLKLDALPPKTALIVSAKPGCAWQMKEQVIPLDSRRLPFTATAPADFAAGAGVFSPPLDVVLNVSIDGRRLQPYATRVRLHRDAQTMLDKGGDGLPSSWDFRVDPKDEGVTARWFAADAPGGWKSLNVTAVWENQGLGDYDGFGWYRTRFTPPTVKAGNRLWLEFGAIDESCWVYLNGKEIGHQVFDTKVDDLAWQKPRRFDLTGLATPGENLLVVRVGDTFGLGGIYRGAMLYEAPENLAKGATEALTKSWAGTAEGVQVSLDNGHYVDEHSVKVDVRRDGSVELTPVTIAELPAGQYKVSWRYRTQGASSTAKLTIAGAGQALPARNGDEWEEQQATVGLKEAGPLTVALSIAKPGVLWITDVRVTR